MKDRIVWSIHINRNLTMHKNASIGSFTSFDAIDFLSATSSPFNYICIIKSDTYLIMYSTFFHKAINGATELLIISGSNLLDLKLVTVYKKGMKTKHL